MVFFSSLNLLIASIIVLGALTKFLYAKSCDVTSFLVIIFLGFFSSDIDLDAFHFFVNI